MALLKKHEARAWDILFFLFLFLPMVTGGFWYRGPKLKFEITQPLAPALVLALWLWLARKRNLAGASFVCRSFRSGWHAWTTGLERRPSRWLGGAWIFFGALWFLTAWFRHSGLRSGSIDLGIFTNAFWNLAQTGTPFAALKSGHSLLTDHQSFIIYPLTAIYALYPGPGILLFLQALGLTSGAIALYLLGRQRLDRAHLLLPLLPFLYWLYFPTRAANLFDFHPEVFLLPAFLFAVWGIQETSWPKRLLGIFFFLLGMSAKESGGPVAVGIGLAWMAGMGPGETKKFTRAFGFFAIAGGLLLFWFETKIIPQWLGVTYGYGDVYSPLGSTISELALAPFRHPGEFFSRLLAPSRLKFLSLTLLPLGFLPLLAPAALLASLPGIAMLFLTQGDQRLSLGFHYTIEPSVGYFLALVVALSLPLLAPEARRRKLLLLLPWLAIFLYGRSEPFHWRFYTLTDHQRWIKAEVLPRVHPTATLAASNALVPHLALRHWSHFLPILLTEKNEPVECVLWDLSVSNSPMTDSDAEKLNAELAKGFQREFSCGSLSMYRRNDFASSCLTTTPHCPSVP